MEVKVMLFFKKGHFYAEVFVLLAKFVGLARRFTRVLLELRRHLSELFG